MSTAGWLEAARHWLILCSGGHGRSVADAIRAQGDAVFGFLDDSRPADELVAAVLVIGPLSLAWDGAPTPDRCVVAAIGNPVLRHRVVIHPRACVSPSAQLAPGCVVLAGAVINADARLERGVLVNSGVVVDHDATCGVYSQLGVSAAMAGGSCLGPLASLAAGEVLGCGSVRGRQLRWLLRLIRWPRRSPPPLCASAVAHKRAQCGF